MQNAQMLDYFSSFAEHIGVRTFLATFILVAVSAQICVGQGYNSNVGGAGIALTPRAVDFKDAPYNRISTNDVSIKTTSLDMPLEKAKELLKKTNVVIGAKLGDKGEVSEQTVAFASILFYPNKETAYLTFAEIFNFADHPEGKIYGAMGIYYFGGKTALESAIKNADMSREINVLMGATLHRASLEKFFSTFLSDTEPFLPRVDVLRRSTTTTIGNAPCPIYYPPSPPIIIINPK